MSKNVGSILYIDVEKCRQYTLHRCQKSLDVGSILYIDAQKCRQYTLHRCTKMQYTLHEPSFYQESRRRRPAQRESVAQSSYS